MTSNLGVRPSTALALLKMQSRLRFRGQKAFRPEFFNRLDHVIPFRPLSPEVIRLITAKELQETASREGITRLRLSLQFTEGLISRLAEIGFHPHLGARPLQRAIETRVIAPLSHWLLDHPVYQTNVDAGLGSFRSINSRYRLPIDRPRLVWPINRLAKARFRLHFE